MSSNPNVRPPLPPFTGDTATLKLRLAEDNEHGLMQRRIASINDLPIKGSERKFHWPLGRRPDDHHGLSDIGL
jgi:nuclear transport factor 2 (NTF2) superfamily protein